MATTKEFDSEGFDLDAVAASVKPPSTNGNEVDKGEFVYEIGGGASSRTEGGAETTADTSAVSPVAESERLKELGNAEFRTGNHLDACDYYTEAIEACPFGEGVGPTGDEVLKMRDEFEEAERERSLERHNHDIQRRRKRSAKSSDGDTENDDDDDEKDDGGSPAAAFVPPPHRHGPKLAVYYSNRAATNLHLGRNGDALDDCDVALLFNPTYVKALLRRCTAYERMEKTEEALRDARMAVEMDPKNAAARKNAARLQKIEDERLEQLKVETMGKLKDLGNSILGNFGMSLDNFNAVQDPNTGSYNISFGQGK